MAEILHYAFHVNDNTYSSLPELLNDHNNEAGDPVLLKVFTRHGAVDVDTTVRNLDGGWLTTTLDKIREGELQVDTTEEARKLRDQLTLIGQQISASRQSRTPFPDYGAPDYYQAKARQAAWWSLQTMISAAIDQASGIIDLENAIR